MHINELILKLCKPVQYNIMPVAHHGANSLRCLRPSSSSVQQYATKYIFIIFVFSLRGRKNTDYSPTHERRVCIFVRQNSVSDTEPLMLRTRDWLCGLTFATNGPIIYQKMGVHSVRGKSRFCTNFAVCEGNRSIKNLILQVIIIIWKCMLTNYSRNRAQHIQYARMRNNYHQHILDRQWNEFV